MMLRNQLILAAAGLLGAATFVMAQGPRTGATPEQQLAMLSGYLDLTQQQKAQAMVIFSSARAQAQPLKTQLKLGHEAMYQLVKTNKPDSEIDRLAAQQGALMGRMAGILAKSVRDFYQILTPEQQKKFDDAHELIKNLIEQRLPHP